ncbi:hydrolase [Streptomyces sp. B1866]|uniref:alpha/beta hydrolase family protein n=1 Tax=Streptomyces sp. B1866 TaxID=3075431 RepID=UPI00288EB2F6|nr:hydrolase [Streptomyces sp. B1866]MDT3398592.1 hydrolase [Streptomyces sp. B1866]
MNTVISGPGPSRRRLLLGAALAGVGAVAVPGTGPASAAARGSVQRAGQDERARLELPAPTGPHPVGTVRLHLVDPSRPDPWRADRPERELMVTVRYPALTTLGHPRAPQLTDGEAAGFDEVNNLGEDIPKGRVDWAGTRTFAHCGAPLDRRGGPWPVVLYSPGVVDPGSLGTTLTDELASQGYVVVVLDHTFETTAVEFPGRRVEKTVMLKEFAEAKEHERIPELLFKVSDERVKDTAFVLDELERGLPGPRGPLGPRGCEGALDLDRIGMAGQSAGGFTAVQTMHVDRRLKAAVNLDGVLAYVQDDKDPANPSSAATEGVDRPVLLMGMEGDDHHTIPSWGGLWKHSTGWHRDLTLLGAAHATYTDAASAVPQIARRLGLGREVVTGLVGTVPADRAVAAQRAYVTAFFDRWLRGRGDGGLLDGPSGRYPEVRFVR